MSLYFAVLLFSLEVDCPDADEPLLEAALHVLSAGDEAEALARAEAIGKARETSYENFFGQMVHDRFKGVVDLQCGSESRLFDGMEAAYGCSAKGNA